MSLNFNKPQKWLKVKNEFNSKSNHLAIHFNGDNLFYYFFKSNNLSVIQFCQQESQKIDKDETSYL